MSVVQQDMSNGSQPPADMFDAQVLAASLTTAGYAMFALLQTGSLPQAPPETPNPVRSTAVGERATNGGVPVAVVSHIEPAPETSAQVPAQVPAESVAEDLSEVPAAEPIARVARYMPGGAPSLSSDQSRKSRENLDVFADLPVDEPVEPEPQPVAPILTAPAQRISGRELTDMLNELSFLDD